MEINSLLVEELDPTTIQYLKILGYKESDNVDIASWVTDDGQIMNIVVPTKK